jgi:hypothetical protein
MSSRSGKIQAILAELEVKLTAEELRQLAGAILGHESRKPDGKSRAQALSSAQRSEIERKAAKKSWVKKR